MSSVHSLRCRRSLRNWLAPDDTSTPAVSVWYMHAPDPMTVGGLIVGQRTRSSHPAPQCLQTRSPRPSPQRHPTGNPPAWPAHFRGRTSYQVRCTSTPAAPPRSWNTLCPADRSGSQPVDGVRLECEPRRVANTVFVPETMHPICAAAVMSANSACRPRGVCSGQTGSCGHCSRSSQTTTARTRTLPPPSVVGDRVRRCDADARPVVVADRVLTRPAPTLMPQVARPDPA